ncbi:MAG TPA: ABC transporter ATP-binding protein [Acidothermaceae bacterium]|nr:ABC transporter ATP-binding protein [Acidothermaceae bacterium]
MSAVEIRDVSKSYDGTVVLSDFTLTIADTFITAILGPSGSGKTTLLRLIAGFDRPDAGTIMLGNQVVDDARTHVRPERRGIGYVPQDGALFPHLDAIRNISFGLDRGDRGRAGDLLDLVGLTGLGHRYPHELSGGQQQRVALARALAIRPKLVLLDEPFSSLDASLRVSMRRDIARVLAETRTPSIIVTHDQDEALSLANQVVIIDEGHALAHGSPADLYRTPISAAAARYLGDANLLSADVDAGAARCVLGVVQVGAGVSSGPATVLVRPEQLRMSSVPMQGAVPATIVNIDYYGHDSLAELTLGDGTTVTARLTDNAAIDSVGIRPGDRVYVHAVGEMVAWPQAVE